MTTAEHHSGGMMHIASAKSLIATFTTLIVLTVVTVLVPKLGMSGNIDLVIAMAIATVKATLVALLFMHLRHERGFNVVVFLAAFAFVAIFISFTMVDSFQYQPTLDWNEMIVPPEAGAVEPSGH